MDDYLDSAHIAASARKHGVADDDIRHALRHHWLVHSTKDPSVVMHVGPSMTGKPLEIGVLYETDARVIIHAMPARRSLMQ